jgi:hypothetical protein
MPRFPAMRALIVALVVACGTTPDRPSSDRLALVQTELDSMWARYIRIALAGDTVAWAAFFSDSAWVAEPGAPTFRGRRAIQSAIATELASGRHLSSQLNPEVTELVGAKVCLDGVGTWAFTARAAGRTSGIRIPL